MNSRSTLSLRRIAGVSLGAAAVLAFAAQPAMAKWSSTAAGPSAGKASSLSVPAGGSAAAASSTSINISWTAASAGTTQAQSTYFVTGGGTCNAAATTTGCTVTGLTANTAYTFTVTAKLQNWSSAASGSFGTTTAGSVTITPACPTNGSTYQGAGGTAGNPGTFKGDCSNKLAVTVTDSAGVNTVKISVQQGAGAASCWTGSGSAFTATCDNYLATTAVGSSYSLALTEANMSAATYTVKVQEKTNAAGNALTTVSYSFTMTP